MCIRDRVYKELAKFKFIKKFVHVTTPEVYGSTPKKIKESYNFNPSTPYAISRATMDTHLYKFFQNFKLPVIFTRTANVYGPGQQLYRIIPKAFMCSKKRIKLGLILNELGEKRHKYLNAVSPPIFQTSNFSFDSVNKLRKINTSLDEDSFYPAELMFSKSSKLVQLSTLVDKEILFPKEYPYTSSTTKILRENFKELYSEVNKIINISSKDLIIDIGSNDGNLLNNFKNKHKILGITPEKIGKLAIKKGIQTLIRYFDKSSVNLVNKKYGKAKIITATNVFAHIENVNELMKNILSLLKKDGVLI